MQTGVVNWFNSSKGYGFIKVDGTADEQIFVHFSALNQTGYKTLKQGQKVEFEIGENEKGKMALNVVVIEETT